MPGHSEGRRRRSIRLRGYDYSQEGAYFITICAQDGLHFFGEVVDGAMQPNAAGRMICEMWNALPERFPAVELDAFEVMPNHVHAIVVILRRTGENSAKSQTMSPATAAATPHQGETQESINRKESPANGIKDSSPSLGDIVGAFKSLTTLEYGRGVRRYRWPPFKVRLWQRNYFERVVRNEDELERLRVYIAENPMRWDLDRENPNRARS
jgi:putative transposase